MKKELERTIDLDLTEEEIKAVYEEMQDERYRAFNDYDDVDYNDFYTCKSKELLESVNGDEKKLADLIFQDCEEVDPDDDYDDDDWYEDDNNDDLEKEDKWYEDNNLQEATGLSAGDFASLGYDVGIKPGDIVKGSVEQVDTDKNKTHPSRPFLVLSEGTDNYYGLQLSSDTGDLNPKYKKCLVPLNPKNKQKEGLWKTSYVQCHCPKWLEKGKLERILGHIAIDDLQAVDTKIREIFWNDNGEYTNFPIRTIYDKKTGKYIESVEKLRTILKNIDKALNLNSNNK